MRYVLFTDAASYNNGKKDPSKPQHSYSSAILTQGGNVLEIFGKFNPNTTNNYGEVYAIYYGLKKSLKYLKDMGETNVKIDIYSDSEICVNGINKWSESWKKNAVDGVWRNSSGEEVANQKFFKKIDELVSKPKYKKLFKNSKKNKDIRVFHIKGHVNLRKAKDVDKAIRTFKRVNGIDIPLDLLKYLVDMNNAVDNCATSGLKDCL